MLESTNVELPHEVLVQIFVFTVSLPEREIKHIDRRCGKTDYDADISKCLENVSIKDVITVLSLNKRIFHHLAPKLLPQHFHASIGITSTTPFRRFSNFTEFMKHTFFNLYCRRQKLVKALNKLKIDDVESIDSSVDEFSKRLYGELENPEELHSPHYRVIQFYKDFKRAQFIDYQFLEARSYIFPADTEKKYPNVHFFNEKEFIDVEINRVLLLCKNVINNKNSIMKQFIKSFTIDILFLDEYQTSGRRVSMMDSESTTINPSLFPSVIGKYIKPGNKMFSINTSPFKLFKNSFNLLGLDSVRNCQKGADSKLAFKKSDLKKRWYRMVGPISCADPDDADWTFHDQKVILAAFHEFLISGERMNMTRSTTKSQLKNSLENVFALLQKPQINSIISKKSRILNWDVLPLSQSQMNCLRRTSNLKSKIDKSFSVLQMFYTHRKDQFVTEDSLKSILDEIVQATTINSPKQADTSLLAFSFKNNKKGRKNIDLGFEQMRPKTIVINKPMEPEYREKYSNCL